MKNNYDSGYFFKKVPGYFICLKGRSLVLDFNEYNIIKFVYHKFRGNTILDNSQSCLMYKMVCQNHLYFSEEGETGNDLQVIPP